jgi:hypothetical protein
VTFSANDLLFPITEEQRAKAVVALTQSRRRVGATSAEMQLVLEELGIVPSNSTESAGEEE